MQGGFEQHRVEEIRVGCWFRQREPTVGGTSVLAESDVEPEVEGSHSSDKGSVYLEVNEVSGQRSSDSVPVACTVRLSVSLFHFSLETERFTKEAIQGNRRLHLCGTSVGNRCTFLSSYYLFGIHVAQKWCLSSCMY